VTLALRAAAFVAVAFGVLTLSSGARVLFGDGAAAAGRYVPFIVWFNFLAGFAYVAAGVGLWLRCRWSIPVTAALALMTAVAFAALGIYIAGGGEYEGRTIAAMTLRTLVWTLIAGLAWRSLASRRSAEG
jgi:hypothetical protein